MQKYDHIMFDMDGTFTDSKDFHGRSFQRFFKTLGREVPVEDVKDGLAVTVVDIFRRVGITAEGETEEALARLKDFYRTSADDLIMEIPFAPGAKELFKSLRAGGYRLSVVTNSYQELTERIIELHGLSRCFAEIAGASPHSLGKEERCAGLLARHGVMPARALYVGDAERDIEIANDIGCDSCFVDTPIGWAKEPERLIREQKPTYVTHSLAELAEVLELPQNSR